MQTAGATAPAPDSAGMRLTAPRNSNSTTEYLDDRTTENEVQTLADLGHSYVTEGSAPVELTGHMGDNTHHVFTKQCSCTPNSVTPEPDRPQHGRYTACVIAQQYSSALSSHGAFIAVRTNSARIKKK